MSELCDVLVVGGGSAGVLAAKTAADLGLHVVLLEKQGFLGGLATGAEVGTICGVFRRSKSKPPLLYGGEIEQLLNELRRRSNFTPLMFGDGLWFLPYKAPDLILTYAQTITNSKVELRLHSTLTAISTSAAAISSENTTSNSQPRINSVSALCWDKQVEFIPQLVIDCSGEAIVSSLAGLPSSASAPSQASALVFHITGLDFNSEKHLQTALFKAIISLVNDGTLSDEASRLSIVPGSLLGGTAALKLGLSFNPRPNAEGITAAELNSRALADNIITSIKGRCSEFATISISHFAPCLGVRTGFRPLGRAVLTEKMVLSSHVDQDSIAVGCWPIESWETARAPEIVYGPENSIYDIPSGALESSAVENLLFAGRAISAEDRAIASARVIGTCFSTGRGAGLLAAKRLGKISSNTLRELIESGIVR